MSTSVALRTPAAQLMAAQPVLSGMARACAVRLIDRRTGSAHRINGMPLVIFTHQPEEAAAELLAGRDPLVWEARIDRIGSGGAQ